MNPALVFYTNRFVGTGNAGNSYGPLVFIRPEYKDDNGLLEHEFQHSRIFWRSLGFQSLMYLLSDAAKLAQEVECYKVQIKVTVEERKLNGAQIESLTLKFAGFIANDYGLSVTTATALRLLTT